MLDIRTTIEHNKVFEERLRREFVQKQRKPVAGTFLDDDQYLQQEEFRYEINEGFVYMILGKLEDEEEKQRRTQEEQQQRKRTENKGSVGAASYFD